MVGVQETLATPLILATAGLTLLLVATAGGGDVATPVTDQCSCHRWRVAGWRESLVVATSLACDAGRWRSLVAIAGVAGRRRLVAGDVGDYLDGPLSSVQVG